jgi:protein-S-isoprenylcysteine O-methyltransferase Ste14
VRRELREIATAAGKEVRDGRTARHVLGDGCMSGAPPGFLSRVLVRFGAGALILAALFFGTAGTLDYWQAWVYQAVLFTPMTLVLVYLLRRDPELLERRIHSREPIAAQQAIVVVASLITLLAVVFPGLDRRFGWSNLPSAVVIAADGILLLGYGLFFLVLRENSYASRTVQVMAGQRVVTSGPYRVVRYPVYLTVMVMYIASPLALGSVWALLPALLLPIFLVARIRNEERLLTDDLPGYREYQSTTEYRLVPGIW